MLGDPDDHRPGSEWTLVVDPGRPAGRVDGLAVIAERIGPGDRIPLHRHPIDEVILVGADGAIVRLGEERRVVGEGVGIEYLERNPAPGTEGDAPAAPLTYDLRPGEFG